jgi:pyruvate/2-oxoglutarate dehydrogenase complex dihydrolipoamide acyltransferase (E2) component
MRVEIKMPSLGHGMESGKILRWLKAAGDLVERGEGIAEIEGDKVTVEMGALASGKLVEIIHGPGDEVPVGAKIGWIETLE